MNFDVAFFSRYLFDPPGIVWEGLACTIYVSIIALTLGVVIGLLVALARMSRRPWLRGLAVFYIWIWRGTPLIVQLFIAYYGVASSGLYKYPDLVIGPLKIPGNLQAALLVLALNEAAYMAEIFRAAIQSIDKGQQDAARAIGMRHRAAMWWIILPQALRIVIPPLGNEFTLMIKGTSILMVIGVRDLFGTMQNINAATFRTMELYITAAIWYLLLTTLMSVVQKRLEARYGRHESPATQRFRETYKPRSLLSEQR